MVESPSSPGTGPHRVPIDLNDRAGDGLTRALLSECPPSIAVGDRVTVYEPEDGVAADAQITAIVERKGLVFLAVDWNSVSEDSPSNT